MILAGAAAPAHPLQRGTNLTDETKPRGMTAGELAEHIMRAPTRKLDHQVRILTFSPGYVGGSPGSLIQAAQYGIDWDASTFQIVAADRLTKLSPEDVEAIKDSARKGQSWHAYQAFKRQDDRIKALEAELAALKQGGA